ncbi:MAG: hypothetical protein WCF22_11675, partial [Candidatus Sulfotelmatobacter sp.]
MTIAERISLWLREVGGAYCDYCIAKEFNLSRRQQANRVTNALSTTSNFCREREFARSAAQRRR